MHGSLWLGTHQITVSIQLSVVGFSFFISVPCTYIYIYFFAELMKSKSSFKKCSSRTRACIISSSIGKKQLFNPLLTSIVFGIFIGFVLYNFLCSVKNYIRKYSFSLIDGAISKSKRATCIYVKSVSSY